MVLANLFQRHARHILHDLVEGACIAQVAPGIRVAQACQRIGHHRAGLLALLLDGRQGLAPHLFQRLGGQTGVTQQIAHQRDRIGQIFAARTQAHRHHTGAAADAHFGVQGIEAVLHLLTRHGLAALVEQLGHRLGHLCLREQSFFIAKPQRQRGLHRSTACAFGQERHLHAARLEALGSLFDVGRCGFKSLDRSCGRLRLEGLHLGGHVHAGGLGRALRLVRRQIDTQRAIRFQQALDGHALHLLERGITHPIAGQKEQPPVTLRHAFAQGNAHGFGVGEGQLPTLEPLGLGSLEFLGGDRLAGHGFERGEQLAARGIHILSRTELRAKQRKSGVGQPLGKRECCGRQALFGQALVQPAGRSLAHDQPEHLHRSKVRMRARRHVIDRVQHRHAAGSPQGNRAFAVLHRIERVEPGQRARGLLDHAIGLRDPRQDLVAGELARHDQGRVVGLVVLSIELLQTWNVDVLHISARTDGVLAVVVPLVHRGQRLRKQDAVRAVLAHFHLVAHHRHLGVEVASGDVAVGHRIGLPAQIPAQVVVVG